MGVLGDLGSSVTGSIHKAMLCVKQAINGDDSTTLRVGTANVSNIDLRAKLVSNSKNSMSQGVKTFADVKRITSLAGYHVMQVKYNPSTIRLSTQAGSFMQTGPGGAGVNQITQMTVPSQTTMTVDLIFDDVSIPDAFMFDKFSLSTGNLLAAGKGIYNQVAKNGYSVQPQVEGLVALVTQAEARQAVFYWSEMAFAGEVTNVNATYTMFNPQGHPIRAKVTLSIRQSESESGEGDKKYWDNAFTNLFGNYSEDGSADSSSWVDTIGNLLQF